MENYLVLDSNSFINFFEGAFSVAQQEGILSNTEDIEILKKLLFAIEKKGLKLILPEIVITECERNKDIMKDNIKLLYGRIKSGISDVLIPNKKISNKSLSKYSELTEQIIKAETEKIEEVWKLIQKIIKPPNAHVIEIDEKIMLNAYKRGLLGKKPYEIKYINNKDPDKKPVYDIQPDCVFIESVVMFLKKHKLLKKINLYLCTNDNGFYTTIEKIELDQNVRKDLDVKDFYLNLSSFLIKFLKLRKKGKEDAKRTTVKTLDAYPLVPADTTSEQGSDLSVKLVPGDAKAVEEGALSFKVAKGDKNI